MMHLMGQILLWSVFGSIVISLCLGIIVDGIASAVSSATWKFGGDDDLDDYGHPRRGLQYELVEPDAVGDGGHHRMLFQVGDTSYTYDGKPSHKLAFATLPSHPAGSTTWQLKLASISPTATAWQRRRLRRWGNRKKLVEATKIQYVERQRG